jgi:hypothetical protein
VATEQFGRRATLELGDLKIEQYPFQRGLKFSFSVERDKTEMPNSAEVKVWGLSKATRQRLEAQLDLTCRITAGYGDAPGEIFFGVVQDAETIHEGPDRVLRVVLDEEGGNEYMSKEVAYAAPKSTSLKTVLTELIKATGQKLGNASQLTPKFTSSGSAALESGYVAHGSAVFELNLFCRSCGIDWSFQDGQFTGALSGQAYRKDGPLFAPQTGLINVRLDRRGNVEGKALLTPDLRPGVGFRVESDQVNGDFITSATTHAGDNYDEGSWHVMFHGLPYGATSDGLLPEKKKKDETTT